MAKSSEGVKSTQAPFMYVVFENLIEVFRWLTFETKNLILLFHRLFPEDLKFRNFEVEKSFNYKGRTIIMIINIILSPW